MRARQYGRTDCGAESACLTGAGDLDDAAGDVGIDLHEQRILLRDSAGAHNLVRRHAVLAEALDDRARPERRRLDQRAVDIGPRRRQILTEQQAGEALIDENGPIAVIPVEPQKAGLAWALLRRFSGQLSVQRGVPT